MIPRDPLFGVHSKFFESQWLGHQARVQAALGASRGPFGSPEGVARMARNLSGFNAIQRQLQASTQLSDVFSQSHRFTEVFGGGLSQAVSRITRLSNVPLAARAADIGSTLQALPKAEVFRGFWDAMGRASEGLLQMMEDAREGEEILEATEYGFADHMWSRVYLAGFAHVHPRVRDAVVTKKLAAFTSSDAFAGPLMEELGSSRMLRRRSRVIELALEAHRRREYELSIPPLFAKIEGAVGDAMFLKDLVLKEGNKYYLLDGPGGQPKVNRNGKRLGPVTLDPAVRNANLEENTNLSAASEFLSGVLVQRRNDVLHGRDVRYGKAKLSVQALLVLAVLAEGFGKLEEG